MKRCVLALAFVFAAAGARADDAPAPRQVDPERFAPTPREHPTHAAPAPSALVAPSREHPLGACEHAARDYLTCLDATARLSDGAVDAAEALVIASLDSRPRLNLVLKASIAKSLKSVEEDWRALRERECGDLVLIERGLEGPLFEARLICRIRRNGERVEALEARYGDNR